MGRLLGKKVTVSVYKRRFAFANGALPNRNGK